MNKTFKPEHICKMYLKRENYLNGLKENKIIVFMYKLFFSKYMKNRWNLDCLNYINNTLNK
jgi:hypothetical protein